MQMDRTVRALVSAADSEGLPFALWRDPGGQAFRAMISTAAPAPRPIFSGGPAQPFFAMARFDAPAPDKADAIAGDIVAGPEGVLFHEGARRTSAPANAIQSRLANATGGGPVRGRSGGVPPQTGQADYEQLVRSTVEEIEQGPCRKIVLSRAEARKLAPGTDLLDLACALAERYPTAFVALVSSMRTGTWLVATPESLLSLAEGTARTMALAGTQWPAPDTDPATLDWPDKIVEEQGLVAKFVREAFAGCGIEGLEETGPRTVRAGPLCHLRSDFAAALPAQGRAAALSGLLSALHPTPAVCGMPRAHAMAFLRASEGYDRGYYTGYLGPVGLNGRTDLYVNLRSARIIGDTACLFVGGGIVSRSDPELEWQETVQKTRVLGAVL
ncbi:MAG: chorismate-binding protein [Paracoccaceae bacterium]